MSVWKIDFSAIRPHVRDATQKSHMEVLWAQKIASQHEEESKMTLTGIPEDFPRGAPAGAVPGTQPKVLAFKKEGQFFAERSERETLTRYTLCEDLAQQLVAYSARKRSESPPLSVPQLREKVVRAVRQKAFGWGLSPAEREWILRRFDALTPSDYHGEKK